MSTDHASADSLVRHTSRASDVTRSMGTIRAALPLVRALVLAFVATALILVGLPAMLAVAAGG